MSPAAEASFALVEIGEVFLQLSGVYRYNLLDKGVLEGGLVGSIELEGGLYTF